MRWLLRPSRLAIIVVCLVLVYALVGFFLVPYLITAYAIPAVAEKLKRPVLVQEVELNPFTLSLRVAGFEIRETDQSALLGFEEFFINLQASSLFCRAYVFDTIRLSAPYVSARISKDGRVNLAELVPPDDLSLDLKYRVSQKQLEAENKVVVDQLTFGEMVDSPDATSLPVMLAVALLKDRHGRIDIDLPIRGDLKDPDFKYGKAVLSVLLNLLTKIVAFRLH